METRLRNRNLCRKRRALRVRKATRGNSNKPRLSVFRSNKHIQAQLIDDETGVTLFGIGTVSKEFKGSDFSKRTKLSAQEIGKRIAKAALEKNIDHVVFDRGSYKYHGIVAELAGAAREAGLKF